MKTISGSMTTHLAGNVTTLATCWKVTAKDGTVLGFTNHTEDLTVSGVTYKSPSGYTPTNVSTTAGLEVDNLEAKAILDAAGLTRNQVLGGKWDYASLEFFLVNYADLTQGIIKIRKGFLGEVRIGRLDIEAEIRGLMDKMQSEVVELYTHLCRADLGDSRCGVNLASYTVTGTVTAQSGDQRTFADSAQVGADDIYQGGLLTWTGGLNVGLKMEVRKWVLGTKQFQLVLPMPAAIQIGDTYSVYQGCNKSYATCRDKFSNALNFRGEPHVPQNRAIGVAEGRAPEQGGGKK